MPFADVKLRPGVSVDLTPTLNEAGYSQSQLIRFRDGLAQKYGGWAKFYFAALGGVPRDLHAWEDLNGVNHLAVGTTVAFYVITGGALSVITPQQIVSDFSPNFSTVNGQPTVTIVDPNISNVTTFDSVFFNVPISIGGLILSGLYAIQTITGTHSYTITAASNATATVNNAGSVPAFTTTSGSAVVSVNFTANGMALGDEIVFQIPTTGDGVTIDGAYAAAIITDADHFKINAAQQGVSGATFSMNGGNAELVYYITIGPPALGAGYGLGTYGTGGYGTGTVPAAQTGTPITADDWTIDNWGQLILGCPAMGAIYYWDPTGGFTNMNLVSAGPVFNSGIFVSTSEQILIAYGSSIAEQIGVLEDPMLVQWSDSGNFLDWTPTDANFAGNFRIPIGSSIMAGVAGSANQNLIWTDLDLWAMNFIGQPDVFGFNQIGAGAGACSRHCVQKFRNSVYWMGQSNFYVYDGGGVRVLPCPVWDIVFPNLNAAFLQNVRAMPNTLGNEVGWEYPSMASVSGENDSYVKMNVVEAGNPWDYGSLSRSCWIDQSVLGPPIAATPTGVVYQHETTNDADGQPMMVSFTTGYFELDPGEEMVQVDQAIPDFKWVIGASTSAQIQMTFYVVDFPGQTPRTYGPYTVSVTTKYLTVRFRGRQVAIGIASSDLNSLWRLGRCRFRYRPTGRGGQFS